MLAAMTAEGAGWLPQGGPHGLAFTMPIEIGIRGDGEAMSKACWSIAEKSDPAHRAGQIVYRAYKGPSKNQLNAEATGQGYRIVTPIKQIDEDRSVYDLKRCLFAEMLFFPFAIKDALFNAVIRLYVRHRTTAIQMY